MAIRRTARLGHPILRKKGCDLSPEEIRSPEIQRLIQDLIETMGEYGGIGLAAPQVHESLQLAILGFDRSSARYPEMGEQELLVLVNPKVTILGEETQEFWEGCLSVPGLRGLVRRPKKIRVDYLDEHGTARSGMAEGFLATVFQHEIDHLNGIIYIDRVETIPGRTALAFEEEYGRYIVTHKAESPG